MKNTEIKDILEANELHYLKALIDQVRDNQEMINDQAGEAMATNDKDLVSGLVIMTNRLADRQLQMLQMASDLIENTDETIQEAAKALIKQSVKTGECP